MTPAQVVAMALAYVALGICVGWLCAHLCADARAPLALAGALVFAALLLWSFGVLGMME